MSRTFFPLPDIRSGPSKAKRKTLPATTDPREKNRRSFPVCRLSAIFCLRVSIRLYAAMVGLEGNNHGKRMPARADGGLSPNAR